MTAAAPSEMNKIALFFNQLMAVAGRLVIGLMAVIFMLCLAVVVGGLLLVGYVWALFSGKRVGVDYGNQVWQRYQAQRRAASPDGARAQAAPKGPLARVRASDVTDVEVREVR